MDASTNGKPVAKQEIQKPMKQSRQALMEAGLRAYHEVAQDVEELKSEIDRQRTDLKGKDMEIASLRERMDTMRDDHASALSAIESRMQTQQAERDQAVAETVGLKTILVSMNQIWKLAKVDQAPVPPADTAGAEGTTHEG